MTYPKKRRGLILPVSFAIFFLMGGLASAQWLHVRVEDQGEKQETVRLNLPLSLVEAAIPILEKQKIPEQALQFGGQEISVEQMREIWNSIKTQGDYELVAVEQQGTDVRVSIEGNYLYVVSDEGSTTTVNVRLPVSVVDALLSGQGQELNIAAAVGALSQTETGDLISVRDKSKFVRVWIDQESTSM